VTEAQGGTHTADGGWLWLEGFGDLGKEYAAIRDDVAVWDVSPLNKWDLRGPDALRAAQRVFSNDALGLAVGQARYGAFLDADGNIAGTAQRLFTHRHTIRYRLERVRELSGLDVGSTDGREKLSLGLKAMRVLGIAHRGGPAPADGRHAALLPRIRGRHAGRRARLGDPAQLARDVVRRLPAVVTLFFQAFPDEVIERRRRHRRDRRDRLRLRRSVPTGYSAHAIGPETSPRKLG